MSASPTTGKSRQRSWRTLPCVMLAVFAAACETDEPRTGRPRVTQPPRAVRTSAPVTVAPSVPAVVESSVPPAALDGGTVRYGGVTERTGPVPERFRAELPALARDLPWPESGPPQSHVRDGVCSGIPGVRDVFLRSLEAASSASAERWNPYVRLLDGCRHPSRCAWAEEVVQSARPLAVRQVVWWALPGCTSARTAALFDRPEAPLTVVLEHVLRVGADDEARVARPWPRIVSALPALEGGDVRALFPALHALALADTSSRRLLVERFAALDEGAVKWAYGHAACDVAGEEAARACATACVKEPADYVCTRAPRRDLRPEALRAAACDGDGLLWSVEAKAPGEKADVVRAITDCLGGERVEALLATEQGMRVAVDRLDVLARIDRAAARAAAKRLARLLPPTPLPLLRQRLDFLARFATGEDALAELARLGFPIPNERARDPERGAAPDGARLSLASLLVENGFIVEFDPETDQWPNEHDHLARQLVAPLGAALADVIFEEIPPGPGEPYVVRAYAGGTVFETSARNLGDWYDVEAVLALVNAVIQHRHLPSRVALTGLGGNEGSAIAGPAAGIDALVASGEIKLVANGDDRVREAIEGENKTLRDLGARSLPGGD